MSAPQKRLVELANERLALQLAELYGPAKTADELTAQNKQMKQSEAMLRDLMRTDGKPKATPNIPISEAVHTADFKILFPKVVMEVLQRPREANYIGQSLLAKTIQVDGARVMEFPTLGAIRAFELGETQEPPEQDPSFSKNATEIRVRRFGLKLEVPSDVIKYSQWDVMALYAEAAGNAMLRKKEELIFTEYDARAINVFDNTSSNSSYWTTGKGSNGTLQNGTFSHVDLLDMMATLGANGYTPTDIILHPLAWAIWAKDPFLRYQLLHGSMGSHIGNFQGSAETMNANVYVPFGLNVVVTPFQTVGYNQAVSPGASGEANANTTTITVVDRQTSILIMQQEAMRIVQFENPLRDIQNMMFAEKYGLALLNGGRSAVTAKNVRVAMNYEPLYTVKQV